MPGDPSRVTVPVAPLYAAPDARSALASEMLFGERLVQGDRQGDLVAVTSTTDGYRGWLPTAALGSPIAATHRIRLPSAPLQAAGALKHPHRMVLPWLAQLALTGEQQDGWCAIHGGGFVHQRHIEPLDTRHPDPVAMALTLLARPYIWGGRSAFGLDCSALVQLSLAACGIPAPRDSGDQLAALGQAVEPPYRRGDLAFFPGHIGFLLGEGTILHANATRMAVSIDPLDDVIAWAGGLTAVKRLPDLPPPHPEKDPAR